VFEVGGDITLGIADDEQDCVDKAIDGASDTAQAVLAVADAEHAPGQPGGMGSGGDPAAPEDAVAVTRRYAYVGAADFNRVTWGDSLPMDLVEHELGHTLGWVHSGLSADGAYLSGVDLMSNSAAPRDVDPTRRDGPDVLAIHRVLAGWLPMKDVKVAGDSGVGATLVPSTDSTGTRLIVLRVDDATFLTVEWRDDTQYDDHLPAAGVAVHRVVQRAGAVQSIDPVYGTAPFTDLVQPGATLTVDGWAIDVAADGRVDVRPAP
jgi:M6 family metalloprotease-like protein